ncbi:unnamed protein product [Miscanthus lutarioriparius]|uniref:Uncharacterized protein n=1 Tax=Miscanthus lutarioriparius TaxID=422564 RepID=A0A811NR57_9POAL|nr:unnamed protein product [Miscanthus lutarioriparius]
MGRPSIEALAMADADWRAQHCAFDDDDDDDQAGAPPEHLRAFEAFIDSVVPVDMVLAFGREQSARARRGERRRSHEEDVKEKLKLWAKAVAAKGDNKTSSNTTTRIVHAYTVSS